MSEEIPASLAEDFRKLRESVEMIVKRASSGWLPGAGIVWSVGFTDEEFRALEKLAGGPDASPPRQRGEAREGAREEGMSEETHVIPKQVARDAITYARQFREAVVCYYPGSNGIPGEYRVKRTADPDGYPLARYFGNGVIELLDGAEVAK